MRFNDKVAIVTGAAQGIGAAYAEGLLREGASVMVADINTDAGQATTDELAAKYPGKVAFVRVDVSDPESTKAMASATVEQFGGIDYLVNNAAIYGTMEFDLLLTVDWDYYQKFMAVNMNGALLCTRAVVPHMKKGSAIVNQSSTAAWLYSGFYGLAKVGINGLTQQLAHELGGNRLQSSAWAPSMTWSAPACSCSPMTPPGSPPRSSTSTAARCSARESRFHWPRPNRTADGSTACRWV